MASSRSTICKAIPSSTARAMWARLVPRVRPNRAPRASARQCGAEPCERRHEGDPVGVFNRGSERFDVWRSLDEAELVAEPLNRCAGDEGRALERVGDGAA